MSQTPFVDKKARFISIAERTGEFPEEFQRGGGRGASVPVVIELPQAANLQSYFVRGFLNVPRKMSKPERLDLFSTAAGTVALRLAPPFRRYLKLPVFVCQRRAVCSFIPQ
jgi:hypothetical protein